MANGFGSPVIGAIRRIFMQFGFAAIGFVDLMAGAGSPDTGVDFRQSSPKFIYFARR